MEKPFEISFQAIKRSILIVGMYDPETIEPAERLNGWSFLHDVGQDLMERLTADYKVKIEKVVQYEIRKGEIVFDVQVACNRETKQRVISACEQALQNPVAADVTFPQEDPGAIQ